MSTLMCASIAFDALTRLGFHRPRAASATCLTDHVRLSQFPIGTEHPPRRNPLALTWSADQCSLGFHRPRAASTLLTAKKLSPIVSQFPSALSSLLYHDCTRIPLDRRLVSGSIGPEQPLCILQ